MRVDLSRLPSLVAAVASLAALAVLWRFRPEWPALPSSLSSPVTTTLLEQLVFVATWLLAGVVVLLLLVQRLRDMRASRHPDLVRADLSARMREPSRMRRSAGTHDLLRPLIIEPRLLVVAPREAPPAPLEEQGDGITTNPAAGAAAGPDPRPLISLLGPLKIHGGKRSRHGLRARALELIAFLALRREGAQRDEILEALWPGEDPKRSRNRLYQAVRDARQLLGDAVVSERDRYWLDRSSVRVDVDEVDGILQDASRSDAPHCRPQLLENALALFRDEPLAGSDFHWSEGDFRRLRGTYVDLLEDVAAARLVDGDARGALDAAERGLKVDLLNEALWRSALEAEGQLGSRQAVIDRYQALSGLLDDRLGLEPARDTRATYRRLLSQT